VAKIIVLLCKQIHQYREAPLWARTTCDTSKAAVGCSHPRTGAGFGQSLSANLRLTACQLHQFLLLATESPEPLGKACEPAVSSVSSRRNWDNGEVVWWYCSCPAGRHLWCERLSGQMVLATWLRVSARKRIACIAQRCPSAKLLSQGSVCWRTSYVLWRKVVCQEVHQGADLHSCAACRAPLEASGVVRLSALCLGADFIQTPLKRARLSAREHCSRDSASECRAEICGAPDLARSF